MTTWHHRPLGLRIEEARELLDASRDKLTNEGYDERGRALDRAAGYTPACAWTTITLGEAHRLVDFAEAGLASPGSETWADEWTEHLRSADETLHGLGDFDAA